MNKTTKFSLTLLSAFVISACSGGGNKGGDEMPKVVPPKAKIEQPQTQSESPKSEQGELQLQPEAKSQPEANKQPEAKPQPEANSDKPSIEMPKIETDEDAFKHFSKQGNFIGEDNGFTQLVLDGKEIKLAPNRPEMEIYAQKIRPLRDLSNKLVGYYGYAQANIKIKDTGNPDADPKTEVYLLREIDHTLKTTPISDLKDTIIYQGKMYYSYSNIPQQVKVAEVKGSYSPLNKRVGLAISSSDLGKLELRDKHNRNEYSIELNGDERNNVAGYLYGTQESQLTGQKITFEKGKFSGGIYGKKGEIILGEASSIVEHGSEAWKGSVGATAVNTNELNK